MALKLFVFIHLNSAKPVFTLHSDFAVQNMQQNAYLSSDTTKYRNSARMHKQIHIYHICSVSLSFKKTEQTEVLIHFCIKKD